MSWHWKYIYTKLESFWPYFFLHMSYIYELCFQWNKNHIMSRLMHLAIDFLPKLLKVEELNEAGSWADFEAISTPIHKVFDRDFYTLCSSSSRLSNRKKKIIILVLLLELWIFYHNRTKLQKRYQNSKANSEFNPEL